MSDITEADRLQFDADRSDELASSVTVERLALTGIFGPSTLDSDEARDIGRLLCDELPSHQFMLRERIRIGALTTMFERAGHAELVRVRHSFAPDMDSPLQRMLDAVVLGGGAPLDQRNEDELLASLLVWRWITEASARGGATLDMPILPSKDAIESQLALSDVTRAVRKLAGSGCVGRDKELARLHEYHRTGPTLSGQSDLAMVLYGIGGVGKSTLVARFAMDLYERRADAETGVWAYLDLDRPTLASCDADVILDDIIRQVAAQLPDERRKLLRSREVKRLRRKGAGLEAIDTASSYRQPAADFAQAMRDIGGGALLVVIDTYEQLERNQPNQQYELKDLFSLLAAELPHFRLIVSGRTPATVFVEPNRPDRLMHVEDLDDESASELLRYLVDKEATAVGRQIGTFEESLGRDVVELVGGIPLTLRLAARVLVEEGLEAVKDAAARARALNLVRGEFVRGFLYRRILDHIVARPPVTTSDLQVLARAGIALRRISFDLVEQVLIPLLPNAPAASSVELFEALESEVTFVEEDGGALRLREELRGLALAALAFDDPALVRRVHERAATFYESAEDEVGRLEFAYHRLALGTSPGDFDDSILRQLEPVASEFPRASAVLIRDSVGNHQVAIGERDLQSWERQTLPVVDGALRDGRLNEARALLDSRSERTVGSIRSRSSGGRCGAGANSITFW